MESNLWGLDKTIHLCGGLGGMLVFILGVVTIFYQQSKFERLEPAPLYSYAPLCFSGSFSAIYVIYVSVTFFGENPFLENPMVTVLGTICICAMSTCVFLTLYLPLYVRSKTHCNFMRMLATRALIESGPHRGLLVASGPKAPVEIPEHKGDSECVVCREKESMHTTSYVCGHYSVCKGCHPQFVIANHERCPRCKADRIY